MLIIRKAQREAREAVIAARFHGGAEPTNPYAKSTRSHIYWDMGRRRAELALADLMRVGA